MKNKKLHGKIVEIYGSCAIFAKEMEMSPVTLSLKINMKSPWKVPETKKACQLLGLRYPDDVGIFF